MLLLDYCFSIERLFSSPLC